MFTEKLSNMILGRSFREEEYSPVFKSMMSRIANKIYQKKDKRKILMANKVSPAFNQQQQTIVQEAFEIKIRKNSPNTKNSFFFNTVRHGRPQAQPSYQIRQKDSKQKKKFKPSGCFRSKRLSTEGNRAHVQIQMPRNNKFLITKPLKCMQRSRGNFGFGELFRERSQMLSFRQQVKQKYTKKNFHVRNISSDRAQFEELCRSTSLPVQFKDDFSPWQSNDLEYVNFE